MVILFIDQEDIHVNAAHRPGRRQAAKTSSNNDDFCFRAHSRRPWPFLRIPYYS
jgi:hypothetical protein